MTTDSSDSNLVDQLIVEYLDRKQRGESPSIEEYCQLHPEQADEIRSLLKTVDLADADLPDGDATDGMIDGTISEQPIEQLAGYRIVGEIGRGGMGVVYEAEHTELDRNVALKVLPSKASRDPKMVERFLREARSIAKMHHSNIVPLFEVGEADGRFFLAMQLISGRSLDVVIRDKAEESGSVSTENNWANSSPTTRRYREITHINVASCTGMSSLPI
jgi:serine/threonine protein kinase